jgi:hypothetical protein
MADDVIDALTKLVIKHERSIDLLSLHLAKQACLLYSRLERCVRCKTPASVEHVYVKIKLCDRCAAEAIVRSGRTFVEGYINDPNDPFNDVRSSLMNELCWSDIDEADKVRDLIEYVRIIKQFEDERTLSEDRIH